MKVIINQSEQRTATAFRAFDLSEAKRFILALFFLGANFLSTEGWSQTCWIDIVGPNDNLPEACVGDVAYYGAYNYNESTDTRYDCTGPTSVEGAPWNYIDATGAIHWGAAGVFEVKFSCAYGCDNSLYFYISGGAIPSPVTGGGTYCTDETATVTLTNSTKGTPYYLLRNGTYVSYAPGTGGALSWNVTQPGTYTVQGETCSSGFITMPGSASVSFISPPSILSLQGGGTICEGGAFAISLPSSQSGVTYELRRNDGQIVGSLAGTGGQITWSNITAPPGNWSYTATGSNTGCSRPMSGSPAITVNPLPTLYNLTGGGSYCSANTGPTLTLSGSQSGVNYQLKLNGSNTGSPVSGTGLSLIWTNQVSAGNYTITATHTTTGCTQVMSGDVNVNVNPSPTLFTVDGGGYYCFGGTSVTLNGSQLNVNYQLKINETNSGSPVSGTGSSLTWPNQTSEGTYTVVAISVTNDCSQMMNGSATVMPIALPASFTVGGGGSYCSGGSGVNITLSGSEEGMGYQLRRGNVNSGDIVVGTGGPLEWPNQVVAGTYTVRANGTCNLTMTGNAIVTVNQLPTQFAVSGSGAYCAGSATVVLDGSQAGVNYQLKINGIDAHPPLIGTGSSLSWPNQTDAGTYTVEAVNSTTGCARSMFGSAVITINALPTPYSVGGGGSICFGNEDATITLSESESGVSYQLKVNGLNKGTPLVGNGSPLSWPNQTTNGTYIVVATNAMTCSQIMSGAATVSVTTPPVMISGPNHLGDNAIVLSVLPTAGYTYQWKRDGDNIPGAQSPSLTVTEPGSYQVAVTGNDCPGISIPYVVSKDIRKYFNGIIATVRWRTDKPYGITGSEYKGMYTYDYDEKYQVREAAWSVPDFVLGTYANSGNTFRVSDLRYDPNGNILSLRRYNDAGSRIHNFNYVYETNKNKLTGIPGYVNAYTYNDIGQLTGEDKAEAGQDQYIEYDVSGKVRKVFSDAEKTQLKVEYIYDDRGFRLAKVNAVTNRKTWYIRDASGNVLSIYEEDMSNGALNETEVPIYGAGKLGTYYPGQDASINYEITDHLGNVRALVRDNVMEYTATMEDNNLEQIANPRVEELQYFENLFETEAEDAFMNVSPAIPGVVDNPNKVAYLHWNDNAGTQQSDKAIGPAIALKVKAGDKIGMETWTRYEDKTSFARDFNLIALSSLLGNTFLTSVGFDGMTLPQVTSSLQGALQVALYPEADDDSGRPYAYLNYVVYDENMVPVPGGSNWLRVPEEAGSPTEGLYVPGNKPVRLAFDEPVVIGQDGYIYVWVSNQSKDTRVWFDDLTIKHEGIILTQATDYGVWGDVIREQKVDESIYRYGYQGKFAEKDEETGWNHFELREYDPVVGRWLVPDLYKVHWSPYLSMNNSPVSTVDPDGGCENCPPKMGDIKDNTMFDGKDWVPIAKEVVIDIPGTIRLFKQERPYTVDTQRHLNFLFDRPMVKAYEPNFFDMWSDYEGYTVVDEFIVDMIYNTIDGVYVTAHFFTPWRPDIHMNGRPTEGKDKVMAFANTAASFIPANAAIPKFTVATFGTTFKGTFILKPAIRTKAMKGANWATPRVLSISKGVGTWANGSND